MCYRTANAQNEALDLIETTATVAIAFLSFGRLDVNRTHKK